MAELEDKVSTLTRELDSRMFEVDTTRKKANRDAPLLNGTSDIFNSNTGKYETTEELAGLKSVNKLFVVDSSSDRIIGILFKSYKRKT